MSATPPRYDSNGASATRGRSTPETRAASAASGQSGGGRQGSALIAKLEEKKRQEKQQNADDSALTTTDVGHDMEPQADDVVNNAPDKDDDNAAYAAVKETDSSI